MAFDFSFWERDHVLVKQPGGRYACEVCWSMTFMPDQQIY